MKTTRILPLAFCLICWVGSVTAQDVILKKDNTTVLSKVLEITTSEIKYKKWSNQDGPTYTISRSEVTRINFQNGDVEKFSEEAITAPVQQQTITPQPQVQAPIAQPKPEPEKPKSPYSRGYVQFSLNGGLAIPMGDFGTTPTTALCAPFSFFGDEFGSSCGAAKMGFNASIRLHVPVYKKDKNIVGVPLKVNVMYNEITDAENRLFREYWQMLGNTMNEQHGSNAYLLQVTEYSKYLNYSFMGGVDYTHCFSKSFGLFAEASLGLNLAQITSSKINNLYGGTLSWVDYENCIEYYSGDRVELSYKTKTNFAYEIGGGVFLFDHLSVGVFYIGYSPFQVSPTWHEYASYADEHGNYDEGIELAAPKLKVSALSLQLGVHF